MKTVTLFKNNANRWGYRFGVYIFHKTWATRSGAVRRWRQLGYRIIKSSKTEILMQEG